MDAVLDQLPDTLDEVLTQFTPNVQTENAYPITSLTWILVRTEMEDLDTCRGVADVVNYMITDGQQFATENNYVPLPDSLAQESQGQLEMMQAEGESCLPGGGASGGSTTMEGTMMEETN